LQNEDQNRELYRVLNKYIEPSIVKKKNNGYSWEYGYDEKYDMVVISKTGQIGEVININGLNIALPLAPQRCYQRHSDPRHQYWERQELPKELTKIQSIFHWNEMHADFKNKWVEYVEEEFDNRERGYWFMNNGEPTYITGSHYMYLQWSSIDVGYPDYREANRIFFLFWEACKADPRCFGMVYLKIRRSGFSFMAASECVNMATLARDARVGILSKTGADAKKMFTDKVVPINSKLPFFFRPIMDGMDKPKTELAFRVPASKITKKNMYDVSEEEIVGLDTTIDWKNTEENSYDGEKLLLLAHDESGKWVKPNNILNNWRVTKTCLRLGSKIIGKCLMGSTSNALSKGGENFKTLYEESNVAVRNANGQTKSGMYALFIPMEWNMEGFIDQYGMPVLRKPFDRIKGVDGGWISNGAIDYWEAEVDSLKSDSDALNEYYRQFPRTESHAFRDESKQALFNLTKIYQQIDYNDSMIKEHYLTRGSFHWKDGVRDTEVVWMPDKRGRFLVSWFPKRELQNRYYERNGVKYPANEHLGSFGCDSYDISAVVGGRGSNGALHGMTKYHMEDAPVNEFFLEYIARPQTAEIFFEEVLMACVFFGMPILVENNKPRLLYHFKNRGYRGFCMTRPDRELGKLSKTERELGGIPNSSEDVKQAHASAIESYIEKHVGYDLSGTYRDPDMIGTMPFTRTLEDWAKFDINDRTRFDACISSGLAIMANQKHLYQPEKKQTKISVTFARYTNDGISSKLIR
jgi:intein-encoded DNA endonuclease-like protein